MQTYHSSFILKSQNRKQYSSDKLLNFQPFCSQQGFYNLQLAIPSHSINMYNFTQ